MKEASAELNVQQKMQGAGETGKGAKREQEDVAQDMGNKRLKAN